jgi:hypothetical protein
MRVTVAQSGGYVGYLGRAVDDADLDSKGASELSALVERTGLAGSGQRSAPAFGNVPTWEVTIETEQGTQHFELDDKQAEKARPLLQFVQERGKPLPPA